MLIVILRVAKRRRRIQTLHGFRDYARNDGKRVWRVRYLRGFVPSREITRAGLKPAPTRADVFFFVFFAVKWFF